MDVIKQALFFTCSNIIEKVGYFSFTFTSCFIVFYETNISIIILIKIISFLNEKPYTFYKFDYVSNRCVSMHTLFVFGQSQSKFVTKKAFFYYSTMFFSDDI